MTTTKAMYLGKSGNYDFKFQLDNPTKTELVLKVSKANEKFSNLLDDISTPMLNRSDYWFMIGASGGWINTLESLQEEKKETTLAASIPKENVSLEFTPADVTLKGIKEKLRFLQSSFNVKKDSKNNFGNYKYRNCDSIYAAVKPFLAKSNLTLSLNDEVISTGDRFYIKATATLTDCELDESISTSAYAREPTLQKGMSDSQITGTASSYARKYALSGLFLLDDTTDCDSLDNTK